METKLYLVKIEKKISLIFDKWFDLEKQLLGGQGFIEVEFDN